MRAGARALAVIALASGTIAAAWWLARQRADPTAAVSAPLESSGGAPTTPVDAQLERANVLAAEPVVSAATGDARSAVEASPPAEAVAAASAPVATLRVLVQAREDGRPIAGLRVYVSQADDNSWTHVDGARGALGEAPVTGADGRAELEVAPDSPGQLNVQPEGGGTSEREVPAISAGSSFELVVDLPTRPDARLHGLLVDAETEEPLVGEVEWSRGGDGEGPYRTDGAGRFDVAIATWQRAWLKAMAPEHAWTVFPANADHSDPAQPQVLRLLRVATLEVSVRDPGGAPIEGADVELSTKSYHLVRGTEGLLDFSFYVADDPVWRARTGSDGRATIVDAPPRVPLRFAVESAHWPRRAEPEPLRLEPGERRELSVTLGSGATIAGRLEDGGGAPIAHRRLWRSGATSPGPKTFESYDEFDEQTSTDSDGRFEFAAVPCGKWWIGPPPENDDLPAIAQMVQITQETGRIEIVLRADRGLYVRGRVLDPSGAPANSCYVSGRLLDGSASVDCRAKDGDEFALGPLVRGRWRVSASAFGDHVESESIDVEAGQEGVVLRLRLGGGVSGEVVDAETGEREPGDVRLVPSTGDEMTWSMTSANDGAFSFDGIRPGSYAIVARTRDGKVGAIRSLEVVAGHHAEGMRIEVGTGARVQLSFDGKERVASVQIVVDGARLDWTLVAPGMNESVVVPAGVVEFRWSDFGGRDVFRTQKHELAGGEERQVKLVPGG